MMKEENPSVMQQFEGRNVKMYKEIVGRRDLLEKTTDYTFFFEIMKRACSLPTIDQ